jgi:phage shock protein A
MALQLGALREALISGGATPELANKAAEEVATYESRLASTDARLTLLTWMVGANIALTVAVLAKLLH